MRKQRGLDEKTTIALEIGASAIGNGEEENNVVYDVSPAASSPLSNLRKKTII